MSNYSERDKAVLDSLDDNIRLAPRLGVCADTFYALKQEFLRVMRERDEAIQKLSEVQAHGKH